MLNLGMLRMKFQIEWQRVVPLRQSRSPGLMYQLPLEKIPREAGIYIFGRRYGSNFEALYVGQAGNLKGRIRGQLNNLRLMDHLKRAKSGKRILLVGELKGQRGRNRRKALNLVEKAFIRHFLSEGDDLVNRLGVRIRRHEVASIGKHPKRYFPRSVFLER